MKELNVSNPPVKVRAKLLLLPGLGSEPLKYTGPSLCLARAYAEKLGLDVVLLHTDPVPRSLEQAAMDVMLWETGRQFESESFQILASSFGAWVALDYLAGCATLPADYRGALLINPFVSVTKQAASTPWVFRVLAQIVGYKRKGEDGHPGFWMKASLVRSMLARDIRQSDWVKYMVWRHPKHGVQVIITGQAEKSRYYDPEATQKLVQNLGLHAMPAVLCPLANLIGREHGGIAAYYA